MNDRNKLAKPSLVLEGDEQLVDTETRSSKSAVLPFADPVVRHVAERSQRFQGYNDISHLESLQVVSYGLSDYFMHREYCRSCLLCTCID